MLMIATDRRVGYFGKALPGRVILQGRSEEHIWTATRSHVAKFAKPQNCDNLRILRKSKMLCLETFRNSRPNADEG